MKMKLLLKIYLRGLYIALIYCCSANYPTSYSLFKSVFYIQRQTMILGSLSSALRFVTQTHICLCAGCICETDIFNWAELSTTASCWLQQQHRVAARGVQGVQLHPSIFEEDLNCTHQFENISLINVRFVAFRNFAPLDLNILRRPC